MAKYVRTLSGIENILMRNYADPAYETIVEDIRRNADDIKSIEDIPVVTFAHHVPDTVTPVTVRHISPMELTVLHRHDYYEINYVFKGEVIEYVDAQFYTLGADACILLHPDMPHSLYAKPDSVSVNILIKASYFEKTLGVLEQRLGRRVFPSLMSHRDFLLMNGISQKEITETAAWIRRLYIEIEDAENPYGLMKIQALTAKLIFLLSAGNEDGGSRAASGEEIVRTIRDNFSDITVEKLVSRFGYSPAQLYRIVKKETGQSTKDYITSLRLSHSKYLLTDTSLTVSEIAHVLGLSGHEYFSKLFKKHFGVTPSEYRQTKKDGALPSLSAAGNNGTDKRMKKEGAKRKK